MLAQLIDQVIDQVIQARGSRRKFSRSDLIQAGAADQLVRIDRYAKASSPGDTAGRISACGR